MALMAVTHSPFISPSSSFLLGTSTVISYMNLSNFCDKIDNESETGTAAKKKEKEEKQQPHIIVKNTLRHAA